MSRTTVSELDDIKILESLDSDAMYSNSKEITKNVANVLLKYYTETYLRQYFKGEIAESAKNVKLLDRKIYETYFDYVSIDELIENMWQLEQHCDCCSSRDLPKIVSIIADVRFNVSDWTDLYNDISQLIKSLIEELK